MWRLLAILFWFIVIFLVAAFTVPNLHEVTLNYYLASSRLPLAVILLAGIWLGALLGVLFTYHQVLRLRYENRRLRRASEQAGHTLSSSAGDSA